MGTLVLASNGTAYDLDSLVAGWDPIAGHNWVAQNIAYDPTGDKGKPVVMFAGSPATDVVMSGEGPPSYRACAHAPYDPNASTTGPDVIDGPALDIGREICVETSEVPLTSTGGPKTDGNHFALLVVKAITQDALTLAVTVWN
jgi:hypothetical protein